MSEAHFSLLYANTGLAECDAAREWLEAVPSINTETTTKFESAFFTQGVMSADPDLVKAVREHLKSSTSVALSLSVEFVDVGKKNVYAYLHNKKSTRKAVISELRHSSIEIDLYFAIADADAASCKAILQQHDTDYLLSIDGVPLIAELIDFGDVDLLQYAAKQGFDFSTPLTLDKDVWLSGQLFESGVASMLGIAAKLGDMRVYEFVRDQLDELSSYPDLALPPIICAASAGRTDIVLDLAKRGVDINLSDHKRYTPLFHLMEHSMDFADGDEQLAAILAMVDAGAKLDHRAADGANIRWVTTCLFEEAYRYFLQQGFHSVKRPDNAYANDCMQTNLLSATYRRDYEYIIEFFENAADKSSDQACDTLHMATSCNDLDLVKLLIEVGVPASLTDRDGRFAHELAADCGYIELAQFLNERMAAFNAKANNQQQATEPVFRALIECFIELKHEYDSLYDPHKTLGENEKNWGRLSANLDDFKHHTYFASGKFSLEQHGFFYVDTVDKENWKQFKCKVGGDGACTFQLPPVLDHSTFVKITMEANGSPNIVELRREFFSEDDF